TLKLDGVIMYYLNTTAIRLTLAMIDDGTSNTMLVGESRINLAAINTTNDSCDNEPAIRPGAPNIDCDVLRLGEWNGSPMGPAQDIYDPTNLAYFGGTNPRIEQFGSSHPRAMLAALCDGSVRSIAYTVNAATFRNLCIRYDGQTVNHAEFD